MKLRRCWVVAWSKDKPVVGELPLDVEVGFIEAKAPRKRTVYQDSVVNRASCAQRFTDTDKWKKAVSSETGSPADLLDLTPGHGRKQGAMAHNRSIPTGW